MDKLNISHRLNGMNIEANAKTLEGEYGIPYGIAYDKLFQTGFKLGIKQPKYIFDKKARLDEAYKIVAEKIKNNKIVYQKKDTTIDNISNQSSYQKN